VLDEMVATCDALFEGVQPANLDSDVEPLNRLGMVMETIAIPDAPNVNRREVKLRNDELIADRLAAAKSNNEIVAPEAENEAIKRLFEIHAAYKTIQILGQALRNVAGSANRLRKEEVLGKIIGLARRVLGAYFELFAENILSNIIEDMAAAHKEEQPELTSEALRDEVCRHLSGLSQFVCFSVVKHTTFCVGSENLSQTIHRVLDTSSEPMQKVFELSFDLERPGRFPKDGSIKLYRSLGKNEFAAGLVRLLVAHHMYLYVVPIQERQAVCDTMKIKLLRSVMDPSRKRLS
jgi:hypothetical protein